MIWQDWVIATAQAVFIIALIPAVLAPAKPPLSTSLQTGAGVFAIAACMATLELWWSAGTGLLTAALWFVLAWQRHKLTA